MKRGWLTPEEVPTGLRHIDLTVPQGGVWENLFMGALAPLFDPANFQQYGALTPEETADAFREYMFNWTNLFDISEGGSLVVGEVYFFAGGTIPGNSLLCNGAIKNIADYPALYAAIGTNYGGDGDTTFALPDVRGRVLIGAGAGPGLTERYFTEEGGEETHVLALNEIPSHDHLYRRSDALVDTGTAVSAHRGTSANWTEKTEAVGGGAAHNNVQPFLSIPALIRAF